MGKNLEKGGKLYSSKRRMVFMASSQETKTCPTINFSNAAELAKLRDDFSKGLKTRKVFAKLIFK